MNEIKAGHDGAGLRIGVVRSRFNEEIGRASLEACLVRLMELGVHEPLSILDLLDAGTGTHSWSLNEALARIAAEGRGVLVLLNCSESAGQLIERVSEPAKPSTPSRTSLLTYGIGAQILRELKVGRMRVLAAPRKMPSMTGWELEIAGYESPARSGAQ